MGKEGRLQALDPTLYPIEQLEDAFYNENQFIERFHALITNSITPPFAISADGPWGSGKTTLMKLLQRRLKDEYSTFWFNPWECRKTENIVLAFLQNLAALHHDAVDELIKKGHILFNVLLEQGIFEGLQLLKLGKIVKDTQGKFIATDEQQKKTYENYIDNTRIVKNEFKALIDEIGKKYFNKTIIIFFDDLDRCLPDDAIQLLEAVKNLFITPGCQVIFICGIDTHVAKQFIKSHYKDLEDDFAINYFRKIFNLTISMPYTPKIETLMFGYIKKLFKWKEAPNQKITKELAAWNELDAKQADILAKMIYVCGIQAKVSSARTFFNIVHNFYTFLNFNCTYALCPQNDPIVHLLVVKETWQSLYKELVKEAVKNHKKTMGQLLNGLLTSDHKNQRKNQNKFTDEQIAFLNAYFADPHSPFYDLVLADLLFTYPTLA